MKRSKTVLIAVLATVFVLAFSTAALAADTDTEKSSTATVTFKQGALILNSVASFDYGTSGGHVIQSISTDYDVETQTGSVVISDARGTTEGWTLTAQVAGFEKNSVPSLPGAVIAFKDGTATADTAGDTLSAISVPTSVPFTAGTTSATTIASTASCNNGKWTIGWDSNNPVLTVPQATEGTHTAAIQWVLTSSTP